MLGLLINGKGIKEAGLINHPYKLLIMDIDGTLVCKDGTISAEDREALAEVRRSAYRLPYLPGGWLHAMAGPLISSPAIEHINSGDVVKVYHADTDSSVI